MLNKIGVILISLTIGKKCNILSKFKVSDFDGEKIGKNQENRYTAGNFVL